MSAHVYELEDGDRPEVAVVGGKGASLAELSRIGGVRVPDWFCVTTHAFRRVRAEAPALDERIDRLSRLGPDEREALATLGAELRAALEGVSIPDDLAEAITARVFRLGERAAWAVRSSATAEDLPAASFAGQHDSWLNVAGPAAILLHVRRCWASLFTERAVTYRLRNGIDHRKVHMAVVVQRMVFPRAAGVLFTADPLTGNRKVTSVEAVFGLGEALVSGVVNADVYKVRDARVVARAVAPKRLAIDAPAAGGTRTRAIEAERQELPTLTDAEVLRLAEMGRRIEAHFGRPQDIEWCLVDDAVEVVQSRPITTLFPVPSAGDGARRVYISVGHQQMMTDAMKPLGLSLWQLTAARPMAEAGGRLFVDVTDALASRAGRAGLMQMAGRSDPLLGDALRTLVEREDFPAAPTEAAPAAAPTLAALAAAPIEADPGLIDELIARSEASIAAATKAIRTKTGPELLDFILTDLEELKRLNFEPRSMQAIMAAVGASWWLKEHLEAWLGEKDAADTLTLSVPNNVTAEMGLALLDVADVVRRHPDVVAYLENVHDDGFLDELPGLPGGTEARDAVRAWLDRYGMRCPGEIDVTRLRWSERPSMLVPLLLGNVRAFEPGEARRRFEQGREAARRKEEEILERLRALPNGEGKAEETRRMIARVRTFMGYREYPKYGMIRRYFLYKQALLGEARRLVAARVLRVEDDLFYLTFHEVQEVLRTGRVEDALLREREATFRACQRLTPPRVLTSDGEVLTGAYRREGVPSGALVGLPVSGGTVEGRARVLLEMTGAELEPGDILVTTCTDPSWTPLFVAVQGLVTEVGGLMTHGAVIAREYGLPAVVAVENATRAIRDGQRIRVHGTEGYVELLSP